MKDVAASSTVTATDSGFAPKRACSCLCCSTPASFCACSHERVLADLRRFLPLSQISSHMGQRHPLYPRLDLCGQWALCLRYGVIVIGLLFPSESNTAKSRISPETTESPRPS